MVNFYHPIFHHYFIVAPGVEPFEIAPGTEQAAADKHGHVWLSVPVSPRSPRPHCNPIQQQPNPQGQPLPWVPMGQLMGQLLTQPWESSKHISRSAGKPTPTQSGSGKPEHSGGTTTSSRLWKQKRCKVQAQDSATAGATQVLLKTVEKTNQTHFWKLLGTVPCCPQAQLPHGWNLQGIPIRPHLRHVVHPSHDL